MLFFISTALLGIAKNPADAQTKRPLLLANYYCWYHNGQHAKNPFLHWTYPSSSTNALAKQAQKPGEPPPNSAFRPLVGLYDSADEKIAEWHVKLAKSAGIDAFLVDWWDTHNDLDHNVDRGIVAAAGKHGFKFALLDERADFADDAAEARLFLRIGLLVESVDALLVVLDLILLGVMIQGKVAPEVAVGLALAFQPRSGAFSGRFRCGRRLRCGWKGRRSVRSSG